MIASNVITITEPRQRSLFDGRTVCWFSCGATSAAAAKITSECYPDAIIANCSNTLKNEHPDNVRFMRDVERWIGKPILNLFNEKYDDIFDVFEKTGWLMGVGGPYRTGRLKREVRERWQSCGDIHIFGFTADEPKRIERFIKNNPEIRIAFPLRDAGLTKQHCLYMLMQAGIEVPKMYKLGFKNNNCIGCVKGGKGYWNKIRIDFPAYFNRMAQYERDHGVRIFKDVYLDELPPDAGDYESELDIECGPVCNIQNMKGKQQ